MGLSDLPPDLSHKTQRHPRITGGAFKFSAYSNELGFFLGCCFFLGWFCLSSAIIFLNG